MEESLLFEVINIETSALDNFFKGMFGGFYELIAKALLTVLFIVPILILRRLALSKIPKLVEELNKRYMAVKTINYGTWILTVVIVLTLWMEGGKSFVTYIGIMSAGFAVALQAPISNMAGWIFISVKKPFVIGDRIEIDNQIGDVVDFGLFNFSVLEVGNWCDGQSTGRILHIPNGRVFTSALYNFTAGFRFIWNELQVNITFESNWKKGKAILTKIVQDKTYIPVKEAERQIREATQKYMLNWRYLSPIVWTDVAHSGVTLTMRYLCEPRNKRSSEHELWEEVLSAFSEEDDIQFAYQTIRYFDVRDREINRKGPPSLEAPQLDRPT